MRESIYTIPLNDVFTQKDGCPICRMRSMLENRCIEYIMGAAMMEPDIRTKTNRYGFCGEHLSMMLAQKNRLSLALMLETHLDELLNSYMPPAGKKGQMSPAHTCFVCREIDSAMQKLLENTARTAGKDPTFASLLAGQPYYCFAHYEALCGAIRDTLPKKAAAPLLQSVTNSEKTYFQSLRDDVHAFTTIFDYRSTKADRENEQIKTAVEHAVRALS